MPPVVEIQKYPFIRVLVPFCTGIIAGQYLHAARWLWPVAIGAGIVLACCSLSIRERYEIRFLPNIVFFLFFTAAGILCLRIAVSPDNKSFDRKSYPYVIAVTETRPVQKMRSLAVQATIRVLIDSTGRYYSENQRILLYFMPTDEAYALIEGQTLLFKNRLTRIGNNGNPEEFDYSGYMHTRGIKYSQYIGYGQWRCPDKPLFSMRAQSMKVRYKLEDELKKASLTSRQHALLSSLLLGSRELLSPGQKQNFRDAGISHILAISGLHVGVIFFLAYWLLFPLRLAGRSQLHLSVIILLMWIYAFVTGLSPSVLRAAVMLTFFLCGKLLNRKSFTGNALAIAAFLMLLYQPLYLFDPGFQLSFLSVASILIFVPVAEKFYRPRNKVLYYFYSIFIVTVAVQVGITPVIVYYFHHLPLLSCPVNICIVPLLPLILGGGFMLIFSGILHVPDNYLRIIIANLLDFIDSVAEKIAVFPYSAIRNIAITPEVLLLCSLVPVWLYLYVRMKRRGYLILSFILIACCGVLLSYQNIRKNLPPAIVVYNTNGPVTVNLIAEDKHFIVSRDPFFLIGDLEWAARNFWIKHRLGEPEIVLTDVDESRLCTDCPLIGF